MQWFTPGFKIVLATLLACLWAGSVITTTSASAGEQPEASPQTGPPTDPAVERIWELLSTTGQTTVNEEIPAAPGDGLSAVIEVDLVDHRLRLSVDGREAMACPIASGHLASRTPKGEFAVVAVFENELISHRGSFRGPGGELLMEDVDRRCDPMPPGASFHPEAVAVVIQLTEGGPTIQSGLATRTGTTSGDIRIPVSAARTLIRFARNGTAVTIK